MRFEKEFDIGGKRNMQYIIAFVCRRQTRWDKGKILTPAKEPWFPDTWRNYV